MAKDRFSTGVLLVMVSMVVAMFFGYRTGEAVAIKDNRPVRIHPTEEDCEIFTYDPTPAALMCESIIDQARQDALDEWRMDQNAQQQSE